MSWSRILGHRHVIDAFAGIARRGRLAHAYLVVGRPGIGKALFARELAKALLCEKDADTLEACDRCPACALVDAETHPDLFLVSRPEDALEVPIESMRKLCADFGFKPARGRGKVGVIFDADHFNEESANCFLKTLEEPPPRSTLILVGTSPERQLPTIVSRCQVVRMAPLTDDEVNQVLRQQGIDDAELRARLVRAGRGSPGQALALADAALWDFRRDFLDAVAKPRSDAFALSKAFTQFVEDAGKEAAAQRRRAAVVLGLLMDSFTSALRLAVEAGEPAPSGESAQLAALARRAGPDKLLEVLERGLSAERQIDLYIPVTLVVEGLVDGWTRILEENPAQSAATARK